MKLLNQIMGAVSLVFLFSIACGTSDSPTGTTTGTQGGSGGVAGATGQLGGAAGQSGATSQGGAAGQAGSGATSGAAGIAGTAGSGISGAAGMSGGPGAGGAGAGGYPPDATVVDTGVIIDGSPKDIVASDVQLGGGCCKQIDLSLCRFKVSAAWRTCWACDAAATTRSSRRRRLRRSPSAPAMAGPPVSGASRSRTAARR